MSSGSISRSALFLKLLAAAAALLAIAPPFPAHTVPLDEWVADEAMLLGEEPVTRGDLPNEWQGLTRSQLLKKMEEERNAAQSLFISSEFVDAFFGFQRWIYLAWMLGEASQSADALHDFSTTCYYLGEYSLGLACAERSLQLRLELSDLPGEGKTLNNIGAFHEALGQYYKALEAHRQSLSLTRELGDRRGESNSLNNIGMVYNALGQYSEALNYYQADLAICQADGNRGGAASSLNNIGIVYENLGEYEQALNCHLESLKIKQEVGDLRGRSVSLNSIGNVYDELGRYHDALNYYQQSLALNQELGNRQGEADSVLSIGNTHFNQGRYDDALAHYQQALNGYRELGDYLGEARALNNIGNVYDRQGLYDQALETYGQSLTLAREIGDRQDEAGMLSNIGNILSNLQRYEDAVQHYEQAVEISRQIGDPAGTSSALANAGGVFEALGQPERALEYYAEAFKIQTAQAAQFTWETGLKRGMVEELHGTACHLARAQVDLGLADEAFSTAQAAKGVPLLQLLAQAQLPVDDPAVQGQLVRYRDIQGTLQRYRDELYWLAEESNGERKYLNTQIEQCTEQANDAWSYIREHQPRLTEIIEVKGLTTEQVQQEILAPGQILLEYLITEGEVFIFALTKEGALAVTRSVLPELRPDQSLADYLEIQLTRLYSDLPPLQLEAAQDLYSLLVGPVADSIPPAAELIICPDGELLVVPFEALVDSGGEYLLTSHPIRYSTSATLLSYVKSAGGASGAFVAGVSFSAHEDADQTDQSDSTVPHIPVSARNALFEAENFYPLPGVLEETRAVAAILGVQPLLDEQATETVLRQYMPGHEVIHLATHGFLHRVPLLNGIVTYQPAAEAAAGADREIAMLPGGEEDLPRGAGAELASQRFASSDGFLTMSEVMGIPLDGCELVALSCCHSAEGTIAPGEGVMGVSQGFLYAGARTVLASLAKVDDDATRLLMTEFYRNWSDNGQGKSAALRAAKQQLIADPQYAAPRYWAPFVLYGLD